MINSKELLISPIVQLELQYLHEIHRVTDDASAMIGDLSQRIGLQICEKDFNAVVQKGLEIEWTRDPFDRLLVAQTSLEGALLVTRDQKLLDGYQQAVW